MSFFSELGLDELYVAFGIGKSFRFIPCHEIVSSLGYMNCQALPVFHSLTGSDTTSSFSGKGKKSAWEAWKACPAVTETLRALARTPLSVSSQYMEEIKRFVVVLYNKSRELRKCDDARRELFTHGARTLENIPPTSASLHEHVKGSVYQAGYVWSQSLLPNPRLPNPGDWGWTKDNGMWTLFWTPLPEAAKGCYELIHCSCKIRCKPPCRCATSNLKCTELCSCGGHCFISI